MEEVTSQQPQEQQGDAMSSVSDPRPQVSIPPQAQIRKKGKGKGLWIIVLVAIIGLAIFLISRGSKIANKEETPMGSTLSSPSATPTPTATEEPAKREETPVENKYKPTKAARVVKSCRLLNIVPLTIFYMLILL